VNTYGAVSYPPKNIIERIEAKRKRALEAGTIEPDSDEEPATNQQGDEVDGEEEQNDNNKEDQNDNNKED
jgi:hypothetical protein